MQSTPEDLLWPDKSHTGHYNRLVRFPSLPQTPLTCSDTFYLLSIGLGHTAASRLGQACQLAFSMGMHDDAKTDSLGLDAIEVQLRRRVFWQLYVSDK
jgi:hypothetical protein